MPNPPKDRSICPRTLWVHLTWHKRTASLAPKHLGKEMSDFLKESELTERRALIESFVKEIVVRPGNAVVRYSIPMPEDS